MRFAKHTTPSGLWATWIAVGVLWAVAGVPGLAWADAVRLRSEPAGFAVGADLGYFGMSRSADSASALLLQPSLAYSLDERWSLGVDYGLAVLSSRPDNGDADTVVHSANPTVYLYFQPRARLRLGLGFAIPLASVDAGPSARFDRSTYDFAAGMSGLQRIWLWSPDRAAAMIGARWSARLSEELELSAEAWPVALWTVNGNAAGQVFDLFMPTRAELAAVRGPLRLGAALSAVWLFTHEVDQLQLAVVPFARAEWEQAFVEIAYLQNLDEPLAGERGPRIWALQLNGGSSL